MHSSTSCNRNFQLESGQSCRWCMERSFRAYGDFDFQVLEVFQSRSSAGSATFLKANSPLLRLLRQATEASFQTQRHVTPIACWFNFSRLSVFRHWRNFKFVEKWVMSYHVCPVFSMQLRKVMSELNINAPRQCREASVFSCDRKAEPTVSLTAGHPSNGLVSVRPRTPLYQATWSTTLFNARPPSVADVGTMRHLENLRRRS